MTETYMPLPCNCGASNDWCIVEKCRKATPAAQTAPEKQERKEEQEHFIAHGPFFIDEIRKYSEQITRKELMVSKLTEMLNETSRKWAASTNPAPLDDAEPPADVEKQLRDEAESLYLVPDNITEKVETINTSDRKLIAFIRHSQVEAFIAGAKSQQIDNRKVAEDDRHFYNYEFQIEQCKTEYSGDRGKPDFDSPHYLNFQVGYVKAIYNKLYNKYFF